MPDSLLAGQASLVSFKRTAAHGDEWGGDRKWVSDRLRESTTVRGG
jgi:hypothetical protein